MAPGVYFRMHLVGFFDSIESERVERPCAPCARLGGARRTRLRGQANGEKRDPLQTAEATLALVLRPLFGVGNPRGWAERAQATFLALSASVRAQLHCWHAVIRSRIGFSRAVDLFHAPEPHILLRWLSLDPPISQRLPPDHAQTGANQAGRAGGCVFGRIQRSCPAFGSGCVPTTRVPPVPSASSLPSTRGATILRFAVERQRVGGRSPPPSCSACAIPFVSRISWHLGRRPMHPGACGVPVPRDASRCPAHTSSPHIMQRSFHPTLRVARRCISPIETRGWGGRRRKLSRWPGGKRPRYRRGLRHLG